MKSRFDRWYRKGYWTRIKQQALTHLRSTLPARCAIKRLPAATGPKIRFLPISSAGSPSPAVPSPER